MAEQDWFTLINDPIPRPAPRRRPGTGGGQQRAAPSAPAAPKDYFSELNGPQADAPVQPAQTAPPPNLLPQRAAPIQPPRNALAPQKLPIGTVPNQQNMPGVDMNRNIISDAFSAIKGRQDPKFADVGRFEDGAAPVVTSSIMSSALGASDEAYADVLQRSLGDRFISREKDANGYDILTYRDQDGTVKRGYVNTPGLDQADVSRALLGVAPYLGAAGIARGATKGAGLLLRGLAQGVTAATTSVAGDLGNNALGSQQPVDMGKAAAIGGLGAAGELVAPAVGSIWRRFVTVPGLVSKSGKLTAKGEAAARAADLNPTEIEGKIATEFAKTYAKTRNSAESSVAAVTEKEFGLPSTIGQRTKDAEQLLQEKGMRYGLQGQKAKDVMQGFDDAQKAAVARASEKVVEHGSGVAKDYVIPGGNIRTGLNDTFDVAKDAERSAWKAVKDITPHKEALPLISKNVRESLGTMRPDEKLTPTAWRMGEMLDGYMKGASKKKGLDVFGSSKGQPTIDEMRRRLGGLIESAGNKADRTMASRIYDGFNNWIDEAAKKALIAGDPVSAANLKIARGMTRELKQAFSPRGPNGRATPSARILEKLMDTTDTPEGIVRDLFGATGSAASTKNGAVDALKRIRVVLKRYNNTAVGTDTWNSIRTANWMRLVQGKTGDLHSPQIMLTNLKTAMQSQRSMMQVLYKPDELRRVGRFIKALETITYKDPNPSGSGVAVAAIAKQFLGKLMDSVGLNSKLGQAAINMTGLPNAFGVAGAKAAVKQGAKIRTNPRLSGFSAGSGNAMVNNRGRNATQ